MDKPTFPFQQSHICIGVLTSAHGVQGAMKIKSFLTSLHDLSAYTKIVDETGKDYRIRLLSAKSEDMGIVQVEGVTTRNQADTMRNIKLYIPKEQLPPVEAGEYYYIDLIGLKVISEEGMEIGTVTQVNNYGAGDILDIQGTDQQQYSILFRNEFVPEVNLEKKIVIIDSRGLLSNS